MAILHQLLVILHQFFKHSKRSFRLIANVINYSRSIFLFFAAAAGAGIVAPDFGLLLFFRRSRLRLEWKHCHAASQRFFHLYTN
jgi:hypothetical protein